MNSKNINTFILSLGYIREVDDKKSQNHPCCIKWGLEGNKNYLL